MKKNVFFLMLFWANISIGQNTLTLNYSGPDEPTHFGLTPFVYGAIDSVYDDVFEEWEYTFVPCSEIPLTFTLPAGDSFKITNLHVNYSMTAQGSGDQIDQFSAFAKVGWNGIKVWESTEATNNVVTSGTFFYSRDVNLINGTYPGGTIINLSLGGRRVFQGVPGCNTLVNKIDSGSVSVVVSFSNEILTVGNVGIGVSNPVKAMLEVKGVAGTGSTVAAFGTDGAGISIMRNPPTVGFNLYRDNTVGNAKHMAAGAAASMSFDPLVGTFAIDMFPYKAKNELTAAPVRALTVLNNGNIGVRGNAGGHSLSLYKANNTNGALSIKDPQSFYATEFFTGPNEDIKIRGGKGSTDISIFGNSNFWCNTRIGSGGPSTPLTALELYGAIQFGTEIISVNNSNNLIDLCTSTHFILEPNSTNYSFGLEACTNPQSFGHIAIIQCSRRPLNPNTYSLELCEDSITDLSSSCIELKNNDILTLMWRKLPNGLGRWTQVSLKTNY
jgi:hypothetical protein